jgi:hypothetical protein
MKFFGIYLKNVHGNPIQHEFRDPVNGARSSVYRVNLSFMTKFVKKINLLGVVYVK